MGKEKLKYTLTIPLGILIFFILGLLLYPYDLAGGYQWIIIIGVAVFPMIALGEYLDKKFKVASGTTKAAKRVEKSSDPHVPCPSCNQPVKFGTEFCGYCGERIL